MILGLPDTFTIYVLQPRSCVNVSTSTTKEQPLQNLKNYTPSSDLPWLLQAAPGGKTDWTPLAWAVENEKLTLAELLVEKGANLDAEFQVLLMQLAQHYVASALR